MKDTAYENLLSQAPWLHNYGGGLVNALLLAGARTLDDLQRLDPEEFEQLPGVGARRRGLLEQAQEEARRRADHQGALPETPRRVTPDSDIRDVPWIVERYPLRLLNSLGRAGAITAAEVLAINQDAFGQVRGVGSQQRTALAQLQADLATALGHEPPPEPEAPHTEADAPPPVLSIPATLASLSLHDIPDLWQSCPQHLCSSLMRHQLGTVGAILRATPDEFAKLHGVGSRRMTQFAELQEKLYAWLAAQEAGDGGTPAEAEAQPPQPALPAWESLDDALRDLLQATPTQERDIRIWLRYHGVTTGTRATLAEVAEEHGLTRQRVRQIVVRLGRLIPPLLWRPPFTTLRRALRDAAAQCLGLATLGDHARLLQESLGLRQEPTLAQLKALSAALNGSEDAFAVRAHLVEHREACLQLRSRAAVRAEQLLEEIGEGEHSLDFTRRLSQALSNGGWCEGKRSEVVPCCGAREGQVRLPEPYVRAVLCTLDPCPLEADCVLGRWWAVVRNGRVKYAAVIAALHILGCPQHYAELTQWLCDNSRLFDPSDERTVHNCLITSEESILTATRGTYGLREWGIAEYQTVGDQVEALLGERGAPVSRYDIVKLLVDAGVPEPNVRAAFGQQRFVQHADGTLGLSDWVTAGEPDTRGERRRGSVFDWGDGESFTIG